ASCDAALPRIVIDVRFVRIEIMGKRGVDSLTELGDAPDTLDVRGVAVANPDRQRRAPKPIARDRPIDVVREPVTKPALASRRCMPVDAVVPRQHRFPYGGRADEP